MSSSSYLLRITPEDNFDIHILRTFTRDLNGWIVRLQSTSPDASETINQVIYALNLTFREVEQSYRVWRNERVQSVLQNGFHYARARIQAALWRRERGRPVATFQNIYPAFQFANPSTEQPRSSHPTQADAPFYQHNTLSPAGSSSPPWPSPTSPHPQAAQLYPVQNNNAYPRRSEPAAQPPQVGSAMGFSPGFGQQGITGRLNDPSPPHVDYPPPPYPPAHWRPPDPVPGSPPVPAAAAGAVEVAIRYLEAVNKAINICVEFAAM